MDSKMKRILSILGIFILMVSGVFLLTSCDGEGETEATQSEGMEMEMDHEDDGEEGEHDHEEGDGEHSRENVVLIPNDGASILITAPGGAESFSPDEDVLVEVNVEGFALGEEGNHWHVYVDNVSYGMVMGGSTTQAVRGLEPGEHQISVYLSNGGHEELMDGDSILIEVMK